MAPLMLIHGPSGGRSTDGLHKRNETDPWRYREPRLAPVGFMSASVDYDSSISWLNRAVLRRFRPRRHALVICKRHSCVPRTMASAFPT